MLLKRFLLPNSSVDSFYNRCYCLNAFKYKRVPKMSDKLFDPPQAIQNKAHLKSYDEYKKLYDLSINEPAKFWWDIAQKFYWKEAPSLQNAMKYNLDVSKGKVSVEWFKDGVTNVCYNLLDHNVHHHKLGDKVAFYWEGNYPGDTRKITYSQLLQQVCKFSNVLKNKGVKKGDKVAIYMPVVLELVVAMLACARIGAVHSIVFGGYSQESLSNRIIGAEAKVVISIDGVWRGKKMLNMKKVVDDAIHTCHQHGFEVDHSIVVRHMTDKEGSEVDGEIVGRRPSNKLEVAWHKGRDVWWDEEMHEVSDECPPEWMNAEEPLFILYTSGSTGKPKGILHTQGGYMLYVATTFMYTFDHQPHDVFFCTADIGWITGHSYVCYGPLANGATSVIFEGVPFFPDSSRYWQIVDKYKVNKFYTAPTAIRALMKYGDEFVNKTDRGSLEVLGTVGEPINPEAWMWYYSVVGSNKCAIVDTFWQTETGGHVITPLPGAIPTKPGSATFPFFGVVPVLLSDAGKEIEGEGEGHLAFKTAWPGMMRGVYGDMEKYENNYFREFPGYYTCGDGAKRDKDGYWWVTGRIDDMLNVSGHLISTSEVESTLVEHPLVAEAAAVSRSHPVKGECLYVFVTLSMGHALDDQLEEQLRNLVRTKMASFAIPDYIQEAPNLPKTESGKIMRRVLRMIANGKTELGDVSTMADSSVLESLYRLRKE